jgi:TolB-like protein/nucleotide-binding universal stress UspA family protein
MSEKKTYTRRVLVTAAVYVAAAWGAVEALLTVVDRFGLPVWLGTLIAAAFLAGLPVTVYLVWRTAGPERRASTAAVAGSLLFFVIATGAIYWVSRPQPPPPARLIAVMPCEFEGDDRLAYRAESLAEDVHARLARVDALRVSSWNSSVFVHDKGMAPQEIADFLKTDRLVQCRVKTNKERIDLAAQVLDPVSNRVLWTRDFDFPAAEIGTVVTELAGTLLDVLTARAEAAERNRVTELGTFSAEAYDFYLQSSAAEDPDAKEALLRQALAIDPNYADALVRLAWTYLFRFVVQEFESMEEPREWLAEARALSERALEIDAGVYDAREQLARVCRNMAQYYAEPCEEGEAERLDREGCEIRGESAEGWQCRTYRAPENSDEERLALQKWLELEPTSIDANMMSMWLAWHGGSPGEAMSVFETIRFVDPEDQRPYGLISNLLRDEGRLDEVLAWRYGAWSDQLPYSDPGAAWKLGRVATDYLNLGLYEQALEIGLQVWKLRRASAVHFLPPLLLHAGDAQQATEIMQWLSATLVEASGGRNGHLDLATFYADALGDWPLAAERYGIAFEVAALGELCEDDECRLFHALCLAEVHRMLGNEEQAAQWLAMAEDTAMRAEPDVNSTVLLHIARGQPAEAVRELRAAVFAWHSPQNYLEFPLLRLEQSALLDPLREHPDFQQLLSEYEARLAPMRARALEAHASGDWAALRQRAYERTVTASP